MHQVCKTLRQGSQETELLLTNLFYFPQRQNDLFTLEVNNQKFTSRALVRCDSRLVMTEYVIGALYCIL